MKFRFSLRQWLTVPYVALIVGVATLIGALSYRTGSDVVDKLANTLLLETVARIEQAVDRHLVGSAAVLETSFPTGMTTIVDVDRDQTAIRMRFWAATLLHTDPNNYVYYGNEMGRLVAMYRRSPTEVDWLTRAGPDQPRIDYKATSIDGPLFDPKVVNRPLDMRLRPWYVLARTSPTLVWTAVYIDALTRDLVVTRAKRVPDAAGQLQGVVATDVALHHLNNFVRSLTLTPNGLAFIMEADGQLIASSRTPNTRRDAKGENLRMNVRDSGDALQLQAYEHVREALGVGVSPNTPLSMRFTGPDGADVQLAFSRLRDDSGLDWLVVVVVPRSDFMQGVTANVLRTAAIAALAALAAIWIGLLILNWLSTDLQHLSQAARHVGEGQLDEIIEVRGRGTIGELAQTFREMQLRLRTDGLTDLVNRDWLMRCINQRIGRRSPGRAAQDRRKTEPAPFALLFIDLNHFKQVNDTLGHDWGDRVLIEVATRLRAATRQGDIAARYAGDEFVVLLDQVPDQATGEQIRAQVHAVLLAPYQTLANTSLEDRAFGASVGLALFPGTAGDAEELLRQADRDMYNRKQH